MNIEVEIRAKVNNPNEIKKSLEKIEIGNRSQIVGKFSFFGK
jgi:hypothetical protein